MQTNIKWKTALSGRGSATPIVWGDRVFVVTAIDTSGKAVALFDGAVPLQSFRSPNPAGDIWVTQAYPADFNWTEDRAKIKVGLQGNRLSFTSLDAATSFAITASASNTAVTDLGLAASSTGNSDEFVVNLRDGRRIVGVFGVFRTQRPVAPGSGRLEPAPRLTRRQREVLGMLGAGLTTRQMAERTGLSIETVRNHVRAVLRELGVQSRLEAVLVAYRHGMLD